jgi:hypothetical protein
MNKIYILAFFSFFLVSCKEHDEKKQWVFDKNIELPKDSRPLALAKIRNDFWFSDPDRFRLLKIDTSGLVLDSIIGIKRPMNIHSDQGKLYVPEFLTDTIWEFENGSKNYFPVNAKPQAPAGVFVEGDTVAVADFYNHRIILQLGEDVSFIGEEGHDKGQLYYPIDVKIHKNKIYVADAYNHRVQVFDFKGTLLTVIGQENGINVASAIDLSLNFMAVTDQENNRVLIYNLDGNLFQILDNHLNYPTDVCFLQKKLWVTNFKTNELSVFVLARKNNLLK